MVEKYIIPAQTRIGHVHLKVSSIEHSLELYHELLGFKLTTMNGSRSRCGIVPHSYPYPTRKDLAVIYERLRTANYPLTGASDHGVSEALYLNDPDNNGVELYWDRPKELWTYKPDGSMEMFTKLLDIGDLLGELN